MGVARAERRRRAPACPPVRQARHGARLRERLHQDRLGVAAVLPSHLVIDEEEVALLEPLRFSQERHARKRRPHHPARCRRQVASLHHLKMEGEENVFTRRPSLARRTLRFRRRAGARALLLHCRRRNRRRRRFLCGGSLRRGGRSLDGRRHLGRRRRVGGRRRRVADGWREGVGRVRGGDGGCRTVEDPQADARGDTLRVEDLGAVLSLQDEPLIDRRARHDLGQDHPPEVGGLSSSLRCQVVHRDHEQQRLALEVGAAFDARQLPLAISGLQREDRRQNRADRRGVLPLRLPLIKRRSSDGREVEGGHAQAVGGRRVEGVLQVVVQR
mmetsp:Transcript_60933/g.145116  ORF Transcript_60933/g.145116 Transcript_60933/m.145116 type:complete len:329 (+) Transcript_60933:431-1417(+)